MQPEHEPDDRSEDSQKPAGDPLAPAENGVGSSIKSVADLVTSPDFPKSALGELVDIGGYVGVVVDIVRDSLKVRSREGVTKSFNANGLRRIYGPRPEPPPIPEPPPPPPVTRPEARPPAPQVVVKEEPKIEPDFTKPVKNISDYTKRSDYPQCTLGEHIDVAGFTGVVVQIVNRSLKVRSSAEITRSYNADALRRLYSA